MSKYVLVAVAALVVLGTVAAISPEFEALATKQGFLAPGQPPLPEEGGHCPDILGRWECPRYHFFRNNVGFEFREYESVQAVICVPDSTTPGQIYQNLFPCYRALDDYFLGQNSAGLIINRTAPVGVYVIQRSRTVNDYAIIFWLPESLTKPPEPRAGSPVQLVPLNAVALLSVTFGPTDLWGPFGPNEGDYQVYDAVAALEFRAARRGYPIVPNEFVFATYSAPIAAERRANLRHEAWVFLNLSSSTTSLFKPKQLTSAL